MSYSSKLHSGQGWQGRGLPSIGSGTLAIAATVLIALIQLELVFSKSVNWDETWHWSHVYEAKFGLNSRFFQNPHIFLFSWLPTTFTNPLDEIRTARLILWPLVFATAFLIFLAARSFGSHRGAIVAALAYLTGGYVFIHSFALRSDMIAGFLLTLITWIILTKPLSLKWLVASGAALVLAFVATIKTMLIIPSLALLACWRWQNSLGNLSRSNQVKIFAVALIIIVALALLVSRQDFQVLATKSFDRMFQFELSANIRYVWLQFLHALLYSVILLLTLYMIFFKNGEVQLPPIASVALLGPLIYLLFYRNSFPYFYVFLLPLPSIALAAGADYLMQRYRYEFILILLVCTAIALSLTEDRRVTERQDTVQAGMREIFPEPAVYIDDAAFFPHYPRAVRKFGSGWALANYKNAGEPVYADALEQKTVPMLLRLGYALERPAPDPNDEFALLVEDQKIILDNYIRHWGQIYVAGKVISPVLQSHSEYFAIPGPYTVEDYPIDIDGIEFSPGDTVFVGRGEHKVTGLGEGATILRWGEHLPVPARKFPHGRLFTHY